MAVACTLFLRSADPSIGWRRSEFTRDGRRTVPGSCSLPDGVSRSLYVVGLDGAAPVRALKDWTDEVQFRGLYAWHPDGSGFR